MFDQIKQEVILTLIPDFVKTMYGFQNLAGCEHPTTTFIEKLAGLLLPGKLVSIGEPQDQKRKPEESKGPLVKPQLVPESHFVSNIR